MNETEHKRVLIRQGLGHHQPRSCKGGSKKQYPITCRRQGVYKAKIRAKRAKN